MDQNSVPYEMNAMLETLGKWVPQGSKNFLEVVEHTRLDPITGDLWLINNSIVPSLLRVFKIDKAGILQQTIEIDKPRSTMMHDFVLTENYLIFFDCPLVIDPSQMMTGGLLNWRPELGTRIGVLPRKGGNIAWYDTQAFVVLHFANAYESNGRIIIDFVRYPDLLFHNIKKVIPSSFLYRTYIDLQKKSITHEQLYDHTVEFPRIREDRNSLEYKFIYLIANTNKSGLGEFNTLVKFDVHSKTHTSHDFGKQAKINEPVFVPRKNATIEDDGYVMFFLYNMLSNSSELIILDAQNISKQPIARVKMPRRVPHGFHGSWINGEW